jgi:superkiller protein 3
MKIAHLLTLCLALFLAPSQTFAQSDDLALKSHRAKELMAEGKFVQSISLYRELNQAVPNNPGLMLNLGMALHMAGKEREAIPQLEAVVKRDPGVAPAWLFLGAARLRAGQATAAVKALKTFLELQPDHREAREMAASALLSLDRFDEAAEQYQKLTRQQPESAQAWYGLGQCYETLSSRTFEELQKTDPDSGYWLALAAESRARDQQFSSAFYLYRQALEKLPAMRGLHGALANIYQQTGHPDWAEAEQRNEDQLAPADCRAQKLECDFRAAQYAQILASAKGTKSPESYYWLSRAYNQLALDAFARLGQLAPSVELHQLKAHIYENQKRYSEATGEWRQALRLSPGNRQIQKELALSLKFSQDYGAALPLFQELLRQQPASAELNFLVGDTMLNLQRSEDAIPFLQRAVDHNAKLLTAHKSLARAELAVGKTVEAIPHLRAALATDEDGSLHYQLARAYQAGGQPELAKQILVSYQKHQHSAEEERKSAEKKVEITPP